MTIFKSNALKGEIRTGNEVIDILMEFREKKRFAIRGLPLAKKMWRDGYNKALDDTVIYFEMLIDKNTTTD